MKPEVLQSLLTAKVLINDAQALCFVEDKFTASSGLVVLQDALELILIAALIELGVDEQKSIENFSFDQLIGELKKNNVRVIKSGTLKALNRQRVIIKHYGQVSEPQTAGTYFSVAQQAVDDVLQQVVTRTLPQIVLSELIRNEETKQYLDDACEALEEGKYFKCLTSIRKAIYIEIEKDYCVYEWRESDPNDGLGLLGLSRGGLKAPSYTRNRAWISKHVRDPFDYIQRDHNRIRQDLLEWGASTQDFWNIWRLTPEVMRFNSDGEWLLKGEIKHLYQAATQENATFCLDRAVSLLAKKQAHQDLARWLDHSIDNRLRVRLKEPLTLYEKASESSRALTQLDRDAVYDANSVVPGIDGKGRYVNLFHIQESEPHLLNGYVDLDSCELLGKV